MYYIIFIALFIIIYMDVKKKSNHYLKDINTFGVPFLLSLTLITTTLVFSVMLPFYHTIITIVSLIVLFFIGVIMFFSHHEALDDLQVDSSFATKIINTILFKYAVIIMLPITVISFNPNKTITENILTLSIIYVTLYLLSLLKNKYNGRMNYIILIPIYIVFYIFLSVNSYFSFPITLGNTPIIYDQKKAYTLQKLTDFDLCKDCYIYDVYPTDDYTYILYNNGSSETNIGYIKDNKVTTIESYKYPYRLNPDSLYNVGSDMLILSSKSIDLLTNDQVDTLLRYEDHRPTMFTYDHQHYLLIKSNQSVEQRFYSYDNQAFQIITEEDPIYDILSTGKIILNQLYFEDETYKLYTDYEKTNLLFSGGDIYEIYLQINQNFILSKDFSAIFRSGSYDFTDLKTMEEKSLMLRDEEAFNTNKVITEDDILLVTNSISKSINHVYYDNYDEKTNLINPFIPMIQSEKHVFFNNNNFYSTSTFRWIGNNVNLYQIVEYDNIYPSSIFTYGGVHYMSLSIILISKIQPAKKKKTSDQN